MAKRKDDFVLDPEAKESIDQIVEGLRRYLVLLVKDKTTLQEGQVKEGKRK
jgi:hypothetical protein